MRAALCYLHLTVLTLLSWQAAAQKTNCDLSDPAALGRCLKALLNDARDDVRRKADPLHIDDQHFSANKQRFWLNNINVHKLSTYQIGDLNVRFPAPSQISLRATIKWPSLGADLDAKARLCGKFLFTFCTNVHGRPVISLGETTGALTALLNVKINPSGRLVVTPQPDTTKVTLNTASIHVNPRIRSGFKRFVFRLFKNPTRFVTEKVSDWWRREKGSVEREAAAALDDVIKNKLSVDLANILKKGSVSLPSA